MGNTIPRDRSEEIALKAKRYREDSEYREQVQQWNKNGRVRQKKLVFDHYGGVCQCCGEDEFVFLTIDHKNDDGAEHRRTVGSGPHLYRWIIRNNFPDDLRLMCHNCNHGRWINGGICPHETEKKDDHSNKAGK